MTFGELDRWALAAIYGGARGPWGPAMVALTVLGSGWSLLALVPLVGRAHTRRFAGALAAAVAVQAALVWSIKLLVGRVRPWIALDLPAPIGMPHDPSFPSGHAAGSFCVAAFVSLALPRLWPLRPRLRRAASALALLVAALVALSRVYLGAHFPTDVAAGALLGVLIGALAAGLYRRRVPADVANR